MKVDPADLILGQRLNVWVAATALIGGIIWFVIAFRRRGPEPAPVAATGAHRAVARADDAARGGDRRPASVAAAAPLRLTPGHRSPPEGCPLRAAR